MSVSKRATLTSFVGSKVFKPFSRNASITFQMSSRCTRMREEFRATNDDGSANIYNLSPSVRSVICMLSDMKQIELYQTIGCGDLVVRRRVSLFP